MEQDLLCLLRLLKESLQVFLQKIEQELSLRHAKKNARAEDIVQPGHIFPLRAFEGGVLSRAGHTEAACDLARLAGLKKLELYVKS